MERTRLLWLLAAAAALLHGETGSVLDRPNPVEVRRNTDRSAAVERLRRAGIYSQRAEQNLAKQGTDRILVILVEYAGTDTFTFNPTGANQSTWDPIGKADSSEWTGTPGDCSAIVSKYSISGPKSYTYSGPLHNGIERPRAQCTKDNCTDISGSYVWATNFNSSYYKDLIFGNGVKYQYQMQDGTSMVRDLTGLSVRGFYRDMSGAQFDLAGEVVGWVQLPHSVWWYGADSCPGRLSGTLSVGGDGAIPGAGSAKTLVQDAIEAVKKSQPDFDWARYDVDGDGVIDHLWIVSAGLGEAAGSTMLNRTTYGEGAFWPHSASLDQPYPVTATLKASNYVMLPENADLGVMVHEFGHAIGAIDLYNLDGTGAASPGFWSIMSDNWVGHPLGSEPPAFDSFHLDQWGWLQPQVITKPYQEYTVNLGQASSFPGAAGQKRGVRIDLPQTRAKLAVKPVGNWQWWSGARSNTDSIMILSRPVTVPAGGATLRFSAAFQIEDTYDFLWVQVSDDGGSKWTTLTNSHTKCFHASDWAGRERGFADDLCAAGGGGFTGTSAGFPQRVTETFDLNVYAGRSVQVRFWYMTDLSLTLAGAFLDDVVISAGANVAISDGAEDWQRRWTLGGEWARLDEYSKPAAHSYYLQWRNVSASGGFDQGLGDSFWRYGPGYTGLLVWHVDNRYSDDSVSSTLFDPPSFGPKGRVMLVDAHPEPYRDASLVSQGYNNEAANLSSRMLSLDAAFGRLYVAGVGTGAAPRPGVSRFSDASGYYPGAEQAAAGPGDPTQRWITEQWDASTVIPALRDYGMRAPGLKAGNELLYNCTRVAASGTLSCQATTAVLDGGTGNPGDSGANFGWNSEVVSQTDTQATLHVWNEFSAPVGNAASYSTLPLAPGALVSFFGATGVSGETYAEAGKTLPTTLAGAVIKINNVTAPLVYVGPNQVNFQVPYETPIGPATMYLSGNTIGRMQIAEAAPGIFNNGGRAVAISSSWTWVTAEAPARPGDIITLYATGQGRLDENVVSGEMAPFTRLIRPSLPVSVTIGGIQAETVAVLAPGFAGLLQVNVTVPQGLAAGDQPVVMMQGTMVSNSALLPVGQ